MQEERSRGAGGDAGRDGGDQVGQHECAHRDGMRVHLLGVRGSTPAPGIEFARYGGNTSCVAIARRSEPPSLVLDAGTGIQQLAALLDGAPFEGTVLLSHLHWDHVEGLPFCTAVDRDDARTDLFVPAQLNGTRAADALGRMMLPPNFPIGPEELRGKWSFSSLEAGSHLLDQFSVTAAEVAHKGGRTFGYRITDARSSLAYIPDHCPTLYGRGPEGWGDYPRAVVKLSKVRTSWSTTPCCPLTSSPTARPSGTQPSSTP
jgi:hypothetical protein